MKSIKYLSLTISLFLITSCATNGVQPQKIDRISAEEMARIMPSAVASLSLEELVKLSNEGATPDQLIEKIKVSHSSYDLSPSQSVDLNKQGLDSKVLDYIHASREQALRNSVAEEINKREKQKRAELEKLKQRQYLDDPFYSPYGMYPYGYGGLGRHGRRFGFGASFGRPFYW